MNRQDNTLSFSVALVIIAAAFTRLIPHPYNFTAVEAMAVFGGMVIKDKKTAIIFPLAAMLLSDICLQLFTSTKGFYGTSQYFVYAAFLIITFIATFIKKPSFSNVVFSAVWSAIIFFIISNFGVWLSSDFYPKNFAGLAACYWTAIPFYKNDIFGNFLLNSLFGNLFYSALMFLAYSIMERKTFSNKSVA